MKAFNCYSSVAYFWVIFIFQFLPTLGLQLSATYSSVRLPTPDYAHRPWYDGKDSIYLFGGDLMNGRQKVLRYSLSSDTIHQQGSLPISARSGSVHSDWDGNAFYFGAEYFKNDKIIKFCPLTNTSSVVAQLPLNSYAAPSIKLNNNTVLVLGSWTTDRPREITAFELASGRISKLGVSLPLNVSYGGAVKFGRKKAYVISMEGEAMWEMDLVSLTFQKMAGFSLPIFKRMPSIMTDGAWIYILAGFKPSPGFPDIAGIFRIDPVAGTSQFLHVDGWPVNGSLIYEYPPPSIYIAAKNRIYSFGGHSFNVTSNTWVYRDEIFYIDLSPKNKTQNSTENSTTTGKLVDEIIAKEDSTETGEIRYTQGSALENKFQCSNLFQDSGETAKCTMIGNQTKELGVFCESKISENGSCHKTGTNIEPEVIHLILTRPALEDGCSFMITGVPDDIEDQIVCRLKSGVGVGLTFDTGEIDQSNYLLAIVLLVSFGILAILIIIGWVWRSYVGRKKPDKNQTVHWESEKESEMI